MCLPLKVYILEGKKANLCDDVLLLIGQCMQINTVYIIAGLLPKKVITVSFFISVIKTKILNILCCSIGCP